MNDYDNNMMDDLDFPDQMEMMPTEMELQDYQDLQQFDQPEMMDDYSDFDMGGFDDW